MDLCLDWSNQLVFYTKYTNPMKPMYMYGTSGPATGTPVAYVFYGVTRPSRVTLFASC